MRKSKPNSFLTSKILLPDNKMQAKLELLDGLFGNSADAPNLKKNFIGKAILPNMGLVYGRSIGRSRERSESTLS
jgi:hypothetical protein